MCLLQYWHKILAKEEGYVWGDYSVKDLYEITYQNALY